MKVRELSSILYLIVTAGLYYWFLRSMKNSQEQFQRALLNRFSDYSASQFPDVAAKLFDVEPVTDSFPTDELHIEGLDSE